MAGETVDTLAADETLRLADFARACKAATRVVALYPATHPAITTCLTRVGETAARLRGQGSAVLTVLPESLLLDGRSAAKIESALAELAALLHSHLIGELRLTGDLSPEAWHRFLSLVGRSPEEMRSSGGVAHEWLAAGGGPIELRQIDYAEVLRERAGALDSKWERIISNYLEGDLSEIDDEAAAALFDIACDSARLADFTEQLVAKASETGRRGKKHVVLRLLQALADFVARNHPAQLDRILNQVTSIVPRLTPELLLTLITSGGAASETGQQGIDLTGEVRARLSDRTVAEFVARSVARDHGATARLAEAFPVLVPDADQRQALVGMAEHEAANLPLGRRPDFQQLWSHAAELLTNYSDEQYVSNDYGRELATARAHAIDVERVSDDPPERVNAWRHTVSEDAVRQLEHRVLLDLLAIETRADAWEQVLHAAIGAIHQLVLTENVALAQGMLDRIVSASADGQPFCDAAQRGLDRLRNGPLMRHVVIVIRQAPASELEAVSAFCRALGPSVIGALAEALASERGAAVKRLRDVLLSFGAAGRASADELRSSANPAVRRTAVELLRAFGGADALPDLAALLDDNEPAVQREALRAIVQIGTDEAYAVLQQALTSSNDRTRDAIVQALMATRDERAAPLFVYMLEHTDYSGRLEAVYLSAVQTLGKLGGDAASVEALTRVLYRGEWWAPLRTQRLRRAAADALAGCRSPEARAALERATADGPHGVRRVARAALNCAPRELPRATRRTA